MSEPRRCHNCNREIPWEDIGCDLTTYLPAEEGSLDHPILCKQCAALVAAERERCAKVCEEMYAALQEEYDGQAMSGDLLRDAAKKIRQG